MFCNGKVPLTIFMKICKLLPVLTGERPTDIQRAWRNNKHILFLLPPMTVRYEACVWGHLIAEIVGSNPVSFVCVLCVVCDSFDEMITPFGWVLMSVNVWLIVYDPETSTARRIAPALGKCVTGKVRTHVGQSLHCRFVACGKCAVAMAIFNNTFVKENVIIHFLLQNSKEFTCCILRPVKQFFNNGNVCCR